MTPEARFETHRAGGLTAAKACKQLGVRQLRQELYGPLNPLPSRLVAEEVEQGLRRLLLAARWCVHGGTGGVPFGPPPVGTPAHLTGEEQQALIAFLQTKMCAPCRSAPYGEIAHTGCKDAARWIDLLLQ